MTDSQMESLLLDATLVAAFAPLAAMFFPRCSMPPTTEALPSLGSAWSSSRRRHLGSFWEATAFAWAVASVAFSHLEYGRDGGMLRHVDAFCCDSWSFSWKRD